jgi:hypothetical protein
MIIIYHKVDGEMKDARRVANDHQRNASNKAMPSSSKTESRQDLCLFVCLNLLLQQKHTEHTRIWNSFAARLITA